MPKNLEFQLQQAAIPAVTTISDAVASNSMLSSLKATTNTTTSLMAGLLPSMLGPAAGASSKPKVSFRDRIRSLQHSDAKQPPLTSTVTASSSMLTCVESGHKSTSDDKEKLIESATSIASTSAMAGPSGSSNGKSIRSSVSAMSFKDKIKQLGQQHAARSEEITSAQLKPWSKLKLATVLSGGSSYASLNNSFAESSPTHSQQPPIKVAKIKPTTSTRTAIPKRNATISSSISKLQTAQTSDKLSVKYNERICTSDSEIRSSDRQSSSKSRFKSRAFKSQGEPKIYRSVDDLSPEYGGLPFVKKLKILNERQKLAALEAMTTRSFSLDCPEWSDGNEPEPLIRSHSEGSGMPRSKNTTITSVAPTTYLNTTNAIVPIAPLNMPRSPVSPESNETQERRELKSILKKLSEERGATTQQQPKDIPNEGDELNGLLSAPTVEGYVARHSKFMKSVTFNSTLSSPPASAHSAIEERSSFPLLSGAQTTNEMTTTLIQVEHHHEQHQYIQSDHSFLLLPENITSKDSSLQEDVSMVDDILLSQDEISLPPSQSPFDDALQKLDDSSPMKGSTNPFISNKILVKGK